LAKLLHLVLIAFLLVLCDLNKYGHRLMCERIHLPLNYIRVQLVLLKVHNWLYGKEHLKRHLHFVDITDKIIFHQLHKTEIVYDMAVKPFVEYLQGSKLKQYAGGSLDLPG